MEEGTESEYCEKMWKMAGGERRGKSMNEECMMGTRMIEEREHMEEAGVRMEVKGMKGKRE